MNPLLIKKAVAKFSLQRHGVVLELSLEVPAKPFVNRGS
jgi:hypothetical protein